MTEKHFRGNWTPQLHTAVRQPFLPTPPPQVPKPKEPKKVEPKKEEPKKEEPERMKKPPPEANAPGTVNINDRYNDYRSYISPDGTCVNNIGQIIGYINKESLECGSADEDYLGCIQDTLENKVEVHDNNGEVVGVLDLGTAILRDGQGKIIGEIENTGECKGHYGSYLGRFNGYTFREMKIIALYLILVDPGMLNEVEG